MISFLILTVAALYKEQAGQEVLKQFIGDAIDVHATTSREFVALSSNYIAGFKDDQIQWRRSIPKSVGLKCQEYCISYGRQVQSWSLSGRLNWELTKSVSSVAIADRFVYMISNDLIQVDASDGTILNTWKLPGYSSESVVKMIAKKQNVYIKTLNAVYRLHDNQIEEIKLKNSILVENKSIYAISQKSILNLETLEKESFDLEGKITELGSDLFLVESSGSTTLYRLLNSLEIVEIHKFVNNREFKDFYSYQQVSGHENAVIRVEQTEKNVMVEAVVVSSDVKVIKETVSFDFDNWGGIKETWPFLVKKQDSFIPKVYFTTADGGLHLLGKWSREEALANAFDAVIVELPTGATADRDELGIDHQVSIISRFTTRWIKHLTALTKLRPFDLVQSLVLKGLENSNSTLKSDQHGFRKLVVFATPNKLIAMDSITGNFVWTRYFDMEISKVSISRDSRVAIPPLINVIGTEKGNGIIITLNALEGSFAGEDGGVHTVGPVKQILETKIVDPKTHCTVLAVISDTVDVYPKSKEILELFSKSSFYYYAVESTNIKGFTVENGKPQSIYNLEFPKGEILESYFHEPVGNVASLGRVVGRDVLFKYLNSNLGVFITLKKGKGSTMYVYLIDVVSGTIHSKIAHYGGGNAEIGKKGQVHVTKSENIVIYTFWNHGTAGVDPDLFPSLQQESVNEDGSKKKKRRIGTASKHQEIVVLELYESAVFNKRIESPFYSSFSSDRVSTIGQSFMLQETVSGLGITTTGNGITSKEILVAYDTGVQGISRKVLDARRPTTAPTSTDKEDGLIPYHPAIPKNPLDVMTYYKDIRIAKIKTVETGLESTSLVIGFSGDVLVTKRTPSGAFDTLSDDFGYYQILGALVLLSVGLVIAKQAAQKKELKEAWS